MIYSIGFSTPRPVGLATLAALSVTWARRAAPRAPAACRARPRCEGIRHTPKGRRGGLAAALCALLALATAPARAQDVPEPPAEPAQPSMDAPPMDAPPMDAPPMDAPPMDAPPMDAPPMDAPRLDGPAAALVPPVAPGSAFEVQGDVLLVRTAGSQRRLQIGCAGDLAVQAGEHVYVRCPPQQVARVSLSESAPGSVVFEVLGDVAELRAVDGVPWLIGADGRARRLARSIVPGFSVDAPALGGRPGEGAPDLRLDQILGRVRALDEAGRPDDALDVLTTQVALRRCPPLLWDADTFAAVRQGIDALENPTAAGSGWFFVGLPTLILGAGGGLLGSLVVGLIGASTSGAGEAYAAYAAILVPAISLVVAGALMMMTGRNAFNPTARRFEERRQDVFRRATRPRGVRPTELTPAFGAPDCGAD